MTDGYRTLREAAARIDLSARGRIRVAGDDRVRLIHAMCTNHVQNLVSGTGCYAFFLNPQGRILADANILCFDDHLLLDTEPESRAILLEHLDKYVIADDVTLEDITEATLLLAVEGPQAEALLREAGLPTPGNPLAHSTHGGLTIIRATTTGEPGYRILGPLGTTLPTPAVPEASAEDVAIVRLEHFFPRYSVDITSANLPQETGISDALHFSKGCYLGQEIVERVRSRGHVNRMLAGLQVDGTLALPRAAKVMFEGNEVGEISSSAYSPALLTTVAMAYLRINAAKPGTQVSVDGRAAQTTAIRTSRT